MSTCTDFWTNLNILSATLLSNCAHLICWISVDPIHFGIIVTLNLGVGQQTPSVATVLFTTGAIARLPFWEVFRAG